jgi:Ethanolamine utilization protein EutJ (predicted chaperonin)
MEEIRRPSIQEVRDGPEYEQFYLLDQVRAGEYDTDEEDVSPELRRDIREAMEVFVSMDPLSEKFADNVQRYEPDQETIQELRDLGYK